MQNPGKQPTLNSQENLKNYPHKSVAVSAAFSVTDNAVVESPREAEKQSHVHDLWTCNMA